MAGAGRFNWVYSVKPSQAARPAKIAASTQGKTLEEVAARGEARETSCGGVMPEAETGAAGAFPADAPAAAAAMLSMDELDTTDISARVCSMAMRASPMACRRCLVSFWRQRRRSSL